jgi:hypothetical protein
MPKADVKQFITQLRERGYTVELDHKSHWQVSRNGQHVTNFGCTPTSGRWRANAAGYVKRYERRNGLLK